MADVQKENGFTPIANEILDILCQYTFNGAQLRIIIKIWRLTYGYGRKDHDFALTFLQQTTKLSESTIKREVTSLIKAKVLIVTQKETSVKPRKISFNKDYDQWDISKSGDSVRKQIDLFSDSEGSDMTPREDEGRGFGYDPSEGSDMTPQSGVSRVQIRPPYKEIRSLKKSIKEKEAMFEQFYSIYPRKIAKKKVETSWRTLCKDKDFDPDKALFNTINFIETCKLVGTEVKFMPYPATFLNQKRYEDYATVDPEGLSKAKSKQSSNPLDRLLQEEMNSDGSSRRDITDEVHFECLPEFQD